MRWSRRCRSCDGAVSARCGIPPIPNAMTEDTNRPPVKIRITSTDFARVNLRSRVSEFHKRDTRVEYDNLTATVQSLREIGGRATHMLPALYMTLAARSAQKERDTPYWRVVQASFLEECALQAIALACRSIFDHRRTALSGNTISRLSDETIKAVATYWSKEGHVSYEDGVLALHVLKRLFAHCARHEKILLQQPSMLERRIGLLKVYANRRAAHMSLDNYLFNVVDLIHVVAAIALIGAIIVDFDMPTQAGGYFDAIDDGGWRAAQHIFPHLAMKRIFEHWDIHQQAKLKWKYPEHYDGVEYILNQLPAAIGYWDSELDES